MLTGLTANAQLFDNGNNSTLPGLMIIGASPQTINSPQTSRELVALLPSLVNTNGIVPKSFAIEFSPFWIYDSIRFDKYYKQTGYWRKVFTQTSISIGINSGDIDTNSRDFGIGIRSKFLNGKPGPRHELLMAQIIDIHELQIFIESHFKKMQEGCFCSKILKDSITTAFKIYMDNDITISAEKQKELINVLHIAMDSVQCATTKQEYKQMLLMEILDTKINFAIENTNDHPIGHILEFNAAYGMQFPSARWEYSRSRRAAAWLNYTYRCKSQKLEATAMIRGLADSLDFRTRWAFDAGGLAKWTPTRKFTASVEAAARYRPYLTVQPFTWQVMVNFEYEIDKNFALTANFGRSFEGQYTSGGNMLTLFGVNYNLLSHKN